MLTQADLIASCCLYLAGSGYAFFIHTYLSPVYVMVSVFLVLRDWLKKMEKMDIMYEKLKQTGRTNDDAAITSGTEEKLRKVMDFISENYSADLSREGLAAAVDMNPNYMSRLFKSYTGKKINEYINQLRVNDSIKKLYETNQRIIDIAFSVGFDNIMTFNRSFKTMMNRTPSEYRREMQKKNKN